VGEAAVDIVAALAAKLSAPIPNTLPSNPTRRTLSMRLPISASGTEQVRDCRVSESPGTQSIAGSKGSRPCRRFNDRRNNWASPLPELQADEIRTNHPQPRTTYWILCAIEVWSRLWPSTVVGRRSYRNTLTLFRDISSRSIWCCPLMPRTDLLFMRSCPPCLWASVFVWPGH